MKSYIYLLVSICFLGGLTSCDPKTPSDYTMYIQIDDWTHKYDPGAEKEFHIVITNKMEQAYQGDVVLRIVQNDSVINESTTQVEVAKLEKTTQVINVLMPEAEGTYEIVAEIVAPDGHSVKSRRIVEVDKPIVLDSLDISEL